MATALPAPTRADGDAGALLERTIGTCRTSSSPWSAARSTCCRRARGSAPRRRGRIADRNGRRGADHARRGRAPRAIAQLDQLLHPGDRSLRARGPVLHWAAGEPRGGERRRCSILTRRSGARRRRPVILVREETTPEDFHGMVAARAVLTARGGMTSHAAVVARGMGKCAVVGAQRLEVDAEGRQFSVRRHGRASKATGSRSTARRARVRGDLPTMPSEVMRVINGRCGRERGRIAPSTSCWNGRTSAPAEGARECRHAGGCAHRARFGAEGIGLCRTEHMFFEGDRIHAMREMIVARDENGARRALAKLLPMQRT
jgi:pyruvate, orthophosphate dikinase